MTDVYVGSDGSAPSDGELILEVRGGRLDAYGALYERHSGAARVLARQYVRCDGDADDVVADAFQRVLGMLQQGNGPDTHFRAYLFTVVRRLAADLASGARRTRPTDDDGTFEDAVGPTASPEDPALAGFERTVVARAYQGLPERWRAVLWYTEVERLSPAEVAPILGLTPNGVSALAYRAREGLRIGYLQQHLTSEPPDSCRAINPLLGGYVRGSLANREVVKVDHHLEVCAGCRSLVLELGDVAHGMRAIVAPLVVGLAGTAILGALPLGAATFGAGTAAGAGAVGAGTGGGVTAGGLAAGSGTSVGASAGAGGAGAAAGSGVTAGSAAGASASTAAGAAGTSTAVGTAGAGASAAGAATGTAATAATGTAATAATGTAATAATAATGTAATAATGTAATAAGATVAAGMSGATVVASTGAVAAATVGVVSVLGAIGGGDEVQDAPVEPPMAVASPWPTEDPEAIADVDVVPAPSPDPSADPTSPANVPPFVDAAAGDDLGPVDPPSVDLAMASEDELEPRVTDYLTLRIANPGDSPAVDAHVRLTLPPGMQYSRSSATRGAAPVPQPLTTDTLPCTATAEPQQVLCRLGTLDADQHTTVNVPVLVRDGGTYALVADVWAEDLEVRRLALPPARVAAFGPELTARAADVDLSANPGLATVPFSVRNTGDVATGQDWTVDVRVPKGLVLDSVTGRLGCTVTGSDTMAGVWRCTGESLAPGESVEASARLVADGQTLAGAYPVAVKPDLAGAGPALGSAASVRVPGGWDGALAGVGGTQALCRATGGVDAADAVVTGTYTNRTGRAVTVSFAAAGSTGSSTVLAAGEQTTSTVHDGLRVLEGRGTWTISTTVAGTTYSRSVGTLPYGTAECYDPRWDVDTSARVVNDGGRVTVEGTIVNRGAEPMQAGMSAPDGESDRVRLDVGERRTFVVRTGSTSTDAGRVTFDLYRWVLDVDGDPPAAGVVPARTPTATYPAASIAPRVGTVVPAGACRYDAEAETSTRTFTVPLDNSGSTLPVLFTVSVAGDVQEVRLAGGESVRFDVDVPWGTGEVLVGADGRRLTAADVGFDSCAEAPAWPEVEVTAAPQCDGGDAQLVVDVDNQGTRGWEATLSSRGTTAARPLDAGATARFTVDARGSRLPDGKATLRLARSIEGSTYTVRRSIDHEGTSCVVVAPTSSLDQGAVRQGRRGDHTTSWRKVGVVLDNTGSTVDVVFHVDGPRGLDADVTVPAGQTRTVEPRWIKGRQGGRWTVSAGSWSTTLAAGRFTAAEAGWCAERIVWGEHYSTGDLRSWDGTQYRYTGRDGEDPQAAVRGKSASAPGRSEAAPSAEPSWEDLRTGQARQWERVGRCEYR